MTSSIDDYLPHPTNFQKYITRIAKLVQAKAYARNPLKTIALGGCVCCLFILFYLFINFPVVVFQRDSAKN